MRYWEILLEIFFEVPFIFHRGCFEKTADHLSRLRCIGVVRSPCLKMRGYLGGGCHILKKSLVLKTIHGTKHGTVGYLLH